MADRDEQYTRLLNTLVQVLRSRVNVLNQIESELSTNLFCYTYTEDFQNEIQLAVEGIADNEDQISEDELWQLASRLIFKSNELIKQLLSKHVSEDELERRLPGYCNESLARVFIEIPSIVASIPSAPQDEFGRNKLISITQSIQTVHLPLHAKDLGTLARARNFYINYLANVTIEFSALGPEYERFVGSVQRMGTQLFAEDFHQALMTRKISEGATGVYAKQAPRRTNKETKDVPFYELLKWGHTALLLRAARPILIEPSPALGERFLSSPTSEESPHPFLELHHAAENMRSALLPVLGDIDLVAPTSSRQQVENIALIMASSGYHFEKMARDSNLETKWTYHPEISGLHGLSASNIDTSVSGFNAAMEILVDFQSDLRDAIRYYASGCLLICEDTQTLISLETNFNELGNKIWPANNKMPSDWKHLEGIDPDRVWENSGKYFPGL